MLEQLFWFIVFPFALAFVLGFMSYGGSKSADPTDQQLDEVTH